MAKKLLVPVDGSDHAFKALDLAADLATKDDASVMLLYVIASRELPASVRHFAEVEHIDGPPEWIYEKLVAKNIVQAALERAQEKGLKKIETSLREGDPAKVIADMANTQGVDMVVMGTRGLGDVRGIFLGSVARKVNHMAHCTVITVK
jgi:nucleotide-binding universal stress UspA family protein